MRAAAKCACGAVLGFATDRIGRLVEQCSGCKYEGGVRMVATELPVFVNKLRQHPRPAFDPLRFRCQHPRSTENSAWNKRGWFECRECSRARAQRSKRKAVA